MQPGQMAYDRASTVFSPDGRLFQVEYALQAIQMGGTAVAVSYEGGIVFVAYRNLPVSSLAEAGSIEKSFAIDTGLGCVTAGLIADSRVLVEFLRMEAQRYRLSFGESIPISLLAGALGTHLQQFTQFGGTRPFAVSILLGGFSGNSPELVELDPSGATIGWKAYAIGRNRRQVADFLEEKLPAQRAEESAFKFALQAVAEGSPTPFPAEALDVAFLEPEKDLRRLPTAEVSRRASGLPFIGTPERGGAKKA
ncbi:MAG: archaeal proteasome endopeptidase complex subunit alpha [Thermoplasmata archaeon]|nr:archaeal proteasome endopeptidase complex subunit alpha [Thermoplasmata archaeon]MCI4341256.1 archaeal proteasome endopeptidase complex subunit alpha [Thermoplasmata archaeon]